MSWQPKILYTYSMIKTLYDEDKPYLEMFFPFVIFTIQKKCSSLNKLEKEIQQKFWLNIPLLTLKDIVKNLIRKWYIEDIELKNINKSEIISTKKWIDKYSSYFDKNKEIISEISGLLTEIQNTIREYEWENYSDTEIYSSLTDIIKNNFENFFWYYSPFSKDNMSIKNNHTKKIDILISKYILGELNNNWKNIKILKKIVYWALMCSILWESEINKEIKWTKMDNLVVYIDTNIIFSLLWYHWKNSKKGLEQLIKLIKENNIKVKVFSFSIDEAINYIQYFQNNGKEYIKWMEVDSIYQYFTDKWYNDSDIIKIIDTLDQEIENLWIEVDDIQTNKLSKKIEDYDIETLKNQNYTKKQLDILSKFNCKNKNAKEHDIFVIESLKELRWKNSPRRIELSKYLFLTNDYNLYLTDCIINNKGFEIWKIPNIIYSSILSNYLWIKNPSWESDIQIPIAFSSLESYWIIDDKVWHSFCDKVDDMKEKKEISEWEVSMLISSEEIKKQLIRVSHNSDKKVSKKLVTKSIENVKKTIQKNNKNNTDKKNKGLLELSAKKYSKFYTIIIFTFIIICLIVFFIKWVFYLNSNPENIQGLDKVLPYIYITFPILLSIIYWFLKKVLWKDIYEYIQEYIYIKILNNDLKKINLK